jgi:hypothetical protein
MKNGPGHLAAWALRGILALGILHLLSQNQGDLAGILLISLGASGLIHYICKHHLGNTGQWMDLLFTLLVTFNNLFGLALDFYHTVPGWDVATHYTTSLFLGVSALILMQKGYPLVLQEAPERIILLAIVLFSLGLGGVWEIGEFVSDYLRGTDFQGGLTNTMQDLMVDLSAGIVVGIAWVKRK